MDISPYNNIFKDLEFWKQNYFSDNKFAFSKNTFKLYERVINEFIDFCVEKSDEINFSIKEINRFIVSEFLSYNNNIHETTKSLYLIILKSFFKYISENNKDAVDLLENIQNIKIKIKKKEPLFYLDEEISKIKTALINKFNKTKSNNKKVKSFFIYLLIETGMRAEEVIKISPKDIEEINYEDNEYLKIKITGKGNKERYVYVILNEKELINMYKFFKEIPEYKKITYSSLYTFNKIILSNIQIRNKGLHAYRHYFARNWVENNIDLQTLSETLGHQNIAITSKYYAKSGEKGKLNALLSLKGLK